MKKAIIISVLIIALSFVVYFLFFSLKQNYKKNVELVSIENMQKVYSIREIDSISAGLNYSFTVKNTITHFNRDSLKTPYKTEKPAG